VQGWAGDASVNFERDGRDCIRIDTAFDSAAQSDAFAAAAREWASGQPGTAVGLEGNVASVSACDPGVEAVGTGPRPTPSVFQALGMRSGIISQMLDAGATSRDATCVIDQIFDRLGAAGVAELNTLTDPTDPRVGAGLEASAASRQVCGI
jgi:hypothetical protein